MQINFQKNKLGKMHTPTKQQFQTVIDVLKSVLPQAKDESNFNMMQGFTFYSDGDVCGTVHCIGGWYAIAKQLQLEAPGMQINYQNGAMAMADDLGFVSIDELENWAIKNTYIWGNGYGDSIFTDKRAYGDADTLQDAINHLEKVKDRLPL